MSETIEVPGFKIERLIARGGMAAVYLATQKTLGRQVALKIMDSHNDDSFAERFLNEGRLIASLSHPNVITIYDLGLLADGRAFISMEYIDGGDLENRLRQPIPEEEAIDILKSLASCLHYIHEHDVIHRDIKPANILFRRDGSLVLTDFGIAKQIDSLNNNVKLTRDGVAVGSPGYMSPEQAQAHPVDKRSDIYSVGVIFSEMLLGKNAFEADSYIQTAMNHIQMDIPALQVQNRHFQVLLDRMLAKDPNDRFASAEALLKYIEILPYIDEMPDLDGLDGITGKEHQMKERIPAQDAPSEPPANLHQSRHRAAADDTGYEEPAPVKKKGVYSIISRNDTLIFIVILLAFVGAGFFFFKEVQISTMLNKAEKAYTKNRLLAPENESAYYYYQQALLLDPANSKAQQGIRKLVDRHIELANKAFSENRLMMPEKDCAYYYYQQTLLLDPANNDAIQGMQKLVERYIGMAEKAAQTGNRERLGYYIEKGLAIAPDNARLLELRNQ